MNLPKCPECGQELRPGATGRYVAPKVDESDEGQLRAVLAIVNGHFVIDFGKPVTFVSMPPRDALAMCSAILARLGVPVQLEIFNGFGRGVDDPSKKDE